MNKEQFEYLKRKIKRTYKGFIGERDDVKSTIVDVAKLFNINLDESRLEDYNISEINFDIPMIKIYDNKNAEVFISEYTADAELLSYHSFGIPKFINVRKISSDSSTEKLFAIGRTESLIEQAKISNGEYDLIFEKENTHNVGIFPNESIKQVIRYATNVESDDKKVQQILLNKIFSYKLVYNDSKIDHSFEQKYTYGQQNYIKKDDEQDKYTYNYDNGVIYGIQKLKFKDSAEYIKGICFENFGWCNVNSHLPSHITIEEFPELEDEKYISGIVFIGRTNENINHGLKIFKSKDNIWLRYVAKERTRTTDSKGFNHYGENILSDKERNYPIMEKGTLSNVEIRNIISVLECEFADDKFIKLIIKELQTFGDKIDIRKGFVEEQPEPLDPKLFIYMPLDDVVKFISADKDNYFKLIHDEVEDSIHIKVADESQKVLKKVNDD